MDRKILTICQNEKFPYSIKINNDLTLEVFEKVFSPKYFDDSLFFATVLMDNIKTDSTFLEIGVGTGIIPLILKFLGSNDENALLPKLLPNLSHSQNN